MNGGKAKGKSGVAHPIHARDAGLRAGLKRKTLGEKEGEGPHAF